MDESALIAGLRRGDAEAQHAMYARYADRIYRTALRLTRNEQDAFDISQDTFVRAFERISSFDERSRFSTWLYRIATNEALQLFRRREVEQRHLRQVAENARVSTSQEKSTVRHSIDEALHQLSAEHRAILVLRYQEELNYDEIGQILEIAPGTVASRLNRARSEIRKLLVDDPNPKEEMPRATHLTKQGNKPTTGPAKAG